MMMVSFHQAARKLQKLSFDCREVIGGIIELLPQGAALLSFPHMRPDQLKKIVFGNPTLDVDTCWHQLYVRIEAANGCAKGVNTHGRHILMSD
jgi:hypothetical protein